MSPDNPRPPPPTRACFSEGGGGQVVFGELSDHHHLEVGWWSLGFASPPPPPIKTFGPHPRFQVRSRPHFYFIGILVASVSRHKMHRIAKEVHKNAQHAHKCTKYKVAKESCDNYQSGLSCPVLSCSVLFCSVLFCSVLFCSVLSSPVLKLGTESANWELEMGSDHCKLKSEELELISGAGKQ